MFMVSSGQTFYSSRWDLVRQAIRLGNHSLLLNLGIILVYGLWCIIGLVLCFVFISFLIAGSAPAFERLMNPIALYGFLMPLALLALTSWCLMLVVRLLWCAIPE